MASAGDRLAPTKEIDDARWLPFDDAAQHLTHERDRDVLARAAAALPGRRDRVTVFLVGTPRPGVAGNGRGRTRQGR